MRLYGALNLTESSPPQSFREPIPLDLAKEFLRVTTTEQDRTISGMIAAARAHAELLQNKDLVVKQWDYSLDTFTDFAIAQATANNYSAVYEDELQLRLPLRSVDLFQYTMSDGTVIPLAENTNYTVDLARGLVKPAYGTCWPSFVAGRSSPILLRYQSGYSASHPFWVSGGAPLLVGMKMLITSWYEDRIPYVEGTGVHELPFGITKLLKSGANNRVF